MLLKLSIKKQQNIPQIRIYSNSTGKNNTNVQILNFTCKF